MGGAVSPSRIENEMGRSFVPLRACARKSGIAPSSVSSFRPAAGFPPVAVSPAPAGSPLTEDTGSSASSALEELLPFPLAGEYRTSR